MNSLKRLTVITTILGAALTAVFCGGSQAPIIVVKSSEGGVSFKGTVLPILEDHCASCHGSKGDLSVESYDMLMKGGESGPSIVPGDPDNSFLIQTVEETKGPSMPPAIFHSLTADRIKAIRVWISEGAKDN
jgi:mono/diheme cytochrome c family protein